MKPRENMINKFLAAVVTLVLCTGLLSACADGAMPDAEDGRLHIVWYRHVICLSTWAASRTSG